MYICPTFVPIILNRVGSKLVEIKTNLFQAHILLREEKTKVIGATRALKKPLLEDDGG